MYHINIASKYENYEIIKEAVDMLNIHKKNYGNYYSAGGIMYCRM